MSWEYYSIMKCKKCNNIYEVEESTLNIVNENYDKCPLCYSEGIIISHNSILDAINEQHEKFKNRPKRVTKIKNSELIDYCTQSNGLCYECPYDTKECDTFCKKHSVGSPCNMNLLQPELYTDEEIT